MGFKWGMTVLLIWVPICISICKSKCLNANRDPKRDCWTLSRPPTTPAKGVYDWKWTPGVGGTRVGNRSLMHEVLYECPLNGWGFPSTGTKFRDQLYKNRSSRKIDSWRLIPREWDFLKTFSLAENQFSWKTFFYTIRPWRQLYNNRSSRKIDPRRLFSRK